MTTGVPHRSPRGCLTCKQRRKKCDETRPVCQRCKTGNFRCLGYSHLDDSKDLAAAAAFKPQQRGRQSKSLEAPLFSYAPIRSLPVCGAPSANLPFQMHLGVEKSRLDNAVVWKRRQHPESIIRTLPESVDGITRLVFSQYPRLSYRIFMPSCAASAGDVIAKRLNQSDVFRWSMFLGAQITQTLLDDSGRNNYLEFIHRFHRQIVGVSISALDSELGIYLEVALDLIFYGYMISNSVTGYSLFRDTAPLLLRYVAKFPYLWSDGSTISISCALRTPQYEISKFVLWDTICALILGIPTVLQYDATFCSTGPRGQQPLEWVYGCPVTVIMMLARINASRTSRSWDVHQVVKEREEIEMHLQQWCPKPAYTDDEAYNTIARFAVHECWRQAVLIYLYMGMCGVDSSEPRVEASVRQLVQICSMIEFGSPVSLHLFVPCLVAGVAARQEKQRAAIRQRLSAFRGTNSWIMRGADFVSVLDHLWHDSGRGGRPVKWGDYIRSRCVALPIEV